MIREARPADRPALLALQTELRAPSPDLLAAALSGVGLALVSTAADGDRPRRKDRPVGYLLGIPGPESVHVAEVVVAPDRRREGRATALLSAAVERTDADRITLAVAPDDDAARGCYESFGFAVERRVSDYFDGDPGLLMGLDVDRPC